MRSFQTMGDDQASPGTSAFQRTFSVALQRSGGSDLAPAVGMRLTRNCGTWSADQAKLVIASNTVRLPKIRDITKFLVTAW